ncbi:MAG TPA: hypothetical protein VIF62_10395 [Labilithrix sp.]
MRARALLLGFFGAALIAAACASFGSGDVDAVDGAAPPPGDDVADGGDAKPDGASPLLCDAGAHAVCDDFDDDMLLGFGFAALVEGGTSASVALVPSDASGPFAAHFTQGVVMPDASTCAAEEALASSLPQPLQTNHTARLQLSVRLLTSSASDEIQIATLDLGDVPYQASIRLIGNALRYAEYSGAYSGTDTALTLTPGVWVRLRFDIDVIAGTIGLGTADAPGTMVPYKQPGPKGATGVKTQLFVGLPCTQAATAALTFDVDDVVLDLN